MLNQRPSFHRITELAQTLIHNLCSFSQILSVTSCNKFRYNSFGSDSFSFSLVMSTMLSATASGFESLRSFVPVCRTICYGALCRTGFI